MVQCLLKQGDKDSSEQPAQVEEQLLESLALAQRPLKLLRERQEAQQHQEPWSLAR
jgi:hypothetical protein